MPEALPERVVVLGHLYSDSFAENIGRALSEMGVRSTAIDNRVAALRQDRPGRFRKIVQTSEAMANRSSRVRRLTGSRIEHMLERAEPGLVISTDGYIFPDQLERWRQRAPHARWALWYPDHLANLGSQRCFEAPWDRLFFKDPYLVDRLASHTNLPVQHLPEACLPSRHRTYAPATAQERSRYGCDVALVGNNYPYQSRVLETISPGTLRLYGNPPSPWSHPDVRSAFSGEYVTDRPKFLAFTGAKIVLNTLHYAEIGSANARLFEATACGGFVVTHSNRGVRGLYEAGKEVVAVDSTAELREAVRHYLGADDERSRIADAGQRRAHRDHTYAQRLLMLMRSTCDG